MNANAAVGFIVVIVIIAAGAWYYTSNPTVPIPGMPVDTTPETATDAKGAGTFAELVAREGTWRCDVAMSQGPAPTEGTTYISGSQIRADFTAMSAGREISAHMIQTDGYIYSWTDLVPQGFKMAVSAVTTGSVAQQVVDPNANVEYSCLPWVVDASKFTPPSAVAFMEFSASDMPVMQPQ